MAKAFEPPLPAITLHRRLSPYATQSLVYGVAYVLLELLRFAEPFGPLGLAPWRPAAGWAFAWLLLAGSRLAPAVLLVALGMEAVMYGASAATPALAATSLVGPCVYAAAAGLLRRWSVHRQLESPRGLSIFLAAAATASLVVALMSAGAAALTESSTPFASSVVPLWLGEWTGLLVVAPLLLVHHGARVVSPNLSLRECLSVATRVVAIAMALWLGAVSEATRDIDAFYVLFFPLIWIALTTGMKGATLALAGLQAGLIAALIWHGYRHDTFQEFQFVLLALSMTGLLLGLVGAQRRLAAVAAKEREAALDGSLRFSAIGEMTSALAHELNNPISALTNYLRSCELMIDDAESQAALRETLQKARHEAQRASDVVKRIREFFQTGALRQTRVSVANLVNEAVETHRARAAHEQVQITTDLPRDLPQIIADRLQIVAVLHNLLGNSIDAIAGSNSKQRIVRVEARATAEGIELAVADTGPGIDPRVSGRLFDPFASTKPNGLGLGLAICRTLTEAHGGRLTLAASAHGARFVLSLPARGSDSEHEIER